VLIGLQPPRDDILGLRSVCPIEVCLDTKVTDLAKVSNDQCEYQNTNAEPHSGHIMPPTCL